MSEPGDLETSLYAISPRIFRRSEARAISSYARLLCAKLTKFSLNGLWKIRKNSCMCMPTLHASENKIIYCHFADCRHNN